MSVFRSRRENALAYDILPPEKASPRQARQRAEVVDVQFETVRERPHIVREQRVRFQNDNLRSDKHSGEVIATRVGRWIAVALDRIEGELRRLSADFFSALVAFVFVMVFGLAGGFSLLANEDGYASAGSGLDITHVTLTPQDAGGMKVLLINGIVENRGATGLPVPPIRADIIVAGQVVATTVIAPPTAEMPKAQSRGFSARMPHPGGKMPELRLSFAEADASRT